MIDWKRLIAADGPRQSINALTLYSFAYANDFQTHDLPAYWDNSIITLLLLLSMIATVLIWLISMFLLVIAAVCYIPLLCYIQGNLKVGHGGGTRSMDYEADMRGGAQSTGICLPQG